MQMIDVLQRLAELDAKNPNIVKESAQTVEECGMMGGMSQPHTPASINMTADSGAELTGMLKDIMSLAGLKQVGPDDLSSEPAPATISAEPGVSVANLDSEPDDMKNMIAKIDSMNTDVGGDRDEMPSDDSNEIEKTEETISSLANPQSVPVPPGTQDAAGHPGVGDRMDGDRPKAFKTETTYESLMAEYHKFLGEEDKYTKSAVNHANRMGQMQPDKKAEWDDEAAFLKTAANTKSNVDAALRSLAQSGEFDEIYQALGRDDEVGRALQDMSNDISIEYGYHPDDDIEQIIDTIADQLQQKYGSENFSMESMLKLAGLKK